MKYICFILYCLLISVEYSYSQVITFEKNYGYLDNEFGNYVQQTSDGGYIIIGRITPSINGGDVYLMKIDSSGSTEWIKMFEGGSECIKPTSDNGYIITGKVTQLGSDVYMGKLNDQGDTIWTRTYGGTNNERGYSVEQTLDGGYVIIGDVYNISSDYDVYLIKTDGQGDTIWTRSYGGLDKDFGYSITETADSGYILVGTTRSFGDGWFPGWFYDMYLIKTDKNGDTLWTRNYGGLDNDVGYDVQQTPDGGYIIIGKTLWWDQQCGIFMIKTDSIGDTLWTKVYGDTISPCAVGYSIRLTKDGGFIVTGEWKDKIYLMKTNTKGDTLWTRTYTEGKAYCVQQTNDNGYIIVGEKYISALTGYDVYVIKTDSLGKVYPPDTTTNISLAKNENHEYEIYPNPNQGNFTLVMASINQNLKPSVYLYNILGELVYGNENIKNDYLNIDMSEQPKGIYLIKVVHGDNIFADKIIYQ